MDKGVKQSRIKPCKISKAVSIFCGQLLYKVVVTPLLITSPNACLHPHPMFLVTVSSPFQQPIDDAYP